MNGFWQTLEELFRRDIGASTLEIIVFLIVVFGFFGLLVLAYHLRQRKERKRLQKIREDKWHSLCTKYDLSPEETEFLERLASHLHIPEKKYLLIADPNTFNHALREYSGKERPEAALVKSILKKTGMQQKEGVLTDISVQRRRSARIEVDITAYIAPATEERNADMAVRMFDISRGGCRLENPDRKFSPGDDVKITFTYNAKKYTNIPAAVVKTSSGRKVLHLSFGHVRRKAASPR